MTAKKTVFYLFVSLLLVFVYPLDIDFPNGNQCIYFFWGIKNTGFGFLSDDVLATQPDPFPLFSMLVTYSSNIFGNTIFVFWYWLINLVYVIAVFEIAEEVVKQLNLKLNRPLFTALFLLANSTVIWGFFFFRFFGLDLRWAWDSGFADQGILRGYFQPSCFGVFILLSFMFFAKKKYIPAFVSLAIAAVFHANYIMLSAVFGFVYSLFIIREKHFKELGIGYCVSLLIVSPYLIYVFRNFGHTSPDAVLYIQNHIKGHIHFDYRTWINTKTLLQFCLIVFSIRLLRKTTLFFPLLSLIIILILLTLITYISGSIFLLNLTPWRISVVLVPVSIVSLIAYFSSIKNSNYRYTIFTLFITILLSALYFRLFGNNSPGYLIKWKIITLIIFAVSSLVLFFYGKYVQEKKWDHRIPFSITLLVVLLGALEVLINMNYFKSNKNELIAFSRTNLAKGQLFIVPPEMTDFRLRTGVPVFADSAIYHGNHLPEWERRIVMVNDLYSANPDNVAFLLDSLSAYCKVTHIVTGNESYLKPGKEVFHNERYTIFELINGKHSLDQ